jgi:hypothetical protein
MSAFLAAVNFDVFTDFRSRLPGKIAHVFPDCSEAPSGSQIKRTSKINPGGSLNLRCIEAKVRVLLLDQHQNSSRFRPAAPRSQTIKDQLLPDIPSVRRNLVETLIEPGPPRW